MFKPAPELSNELNTLASRFAQLSEDLDTSAAAARAAGGAIPPEDPFETAYKRLDAELRTLDGVLQKALTKNTYEFWARFGLILGLALAVLVTTGVLLAQGAYVGGGIAGLVDVGLFGWLLSAFKSLQDERFNLIFRVAAYRPRLATARTLSELDRLAREVAASLQFLTAPAPVPAPAPAPAPVAPTPPAA